VPQAKAMAEAITVTAQAPARNEMKDMAGFARADEAQSLPMDVQVRSDFRSTALWKPDVVTGPDGTARVTLQFPEALTTWRATARAVTTATQVGMGSTTARTNLPLLVRLQGPRFFVTGDRVTISAVMNNNTGQAMRVTPSIDAKGLTLQGNAVSEPVEVPAHGEARAEWTVAATAAGPATLRVTARAQDGSDAMEKTFVVYPHGIDKLIARSGRIRTDEAREARSSAGAPCHGPGRADSAEPRRDDAGRAAVPDRLSIRVHRADDEPLSSGGDRRADSGEERPDRALDRRPSLRRHRAETPGCHAS
jgi:hypothetical protein